MKKRRQDPSEKLRESSSGRATVSNPAPKGHPAVPKRGPFSLFWSILLGACGVFCLVYTWKLGAALVTHLPRVLLGSNSSLPDGIASPPTCRLRNGHIIPGQALCSIQVKYLTVVCIPPPPFSLVHCLCSVPKRSRTPHHQPPHSPPPAHFCSLSHTKTVCLPMFKLCHRAGTHSQHTMDARQPHCSLTLPVHPAIPGPGCSAGSNSNEA